MVRFLYSQINMEEATEPCPTKRIEAIAIQMGSHRKSIKCGGAFTNRDCIQHKKFLDKVKKSFLNFDDETETAVDHKLIRDFSRRWRCSQRVHCHRSGAIVSFVLREVIVACGSRRVAAAPLRHALFQDDILIEMMKQWNREKDDRLHSLTEFISRRSYVARFAYLSKCDHPTTGTYYVSLCFLPGDRLCSILCSTIPSRFIGSSVRHTVANRRTFAIFRRATDVVCSTGAVDFQAASFLLHWQRNIMH